MKGHILCSSQLEEPFHLRSAKVRTYISPRYVAINRAPYVLSTAGVDEGKDDRTSTADFVPELAMAAEGRRKTKPG